MVGKLLGATYTLESASAHALHGAVASGPGVEPPSPPAPVLVELVPAPVVAPTDVDPFDIEPDPVVTAAVVVAVSPCSSAGSPPSPQAMSATPSPIESATKPSVFRPALRMAIAFPHLFADIGKLFWAPAHRDRTGPKTRRRVFGYIHEVPISERVHLIATWTELALGAVTFIALFFVVAPYGRHTRAGWGPTVEQRLGWFLMEAPAFFAFATLFQMGAHAKEPAPMALAGMWLVHYFQRVFVFPARIRARGKRTPLVIIGSAFGFNILNALVCAPAVSEFSARGAEWFDDPRFIAGAALFVAGFAGNVLTDEQLRRLRREGETGYKVPHGGLFELVSSPNYLCEIVEWSGWALASWSLGGAAFALYTIANLAPRARSNHAWYKAEFPDYPAARRALIPFVW